MGNEQVVLLPSKLTGAGASPASLMASWSALPRRAALLGASCSSASCTDAGCRWMLSSYVLPIALYAH